MPKEKKTVVIPKRVKVKRGATAPVSSTRGVVQEGENHQSYSTSSHTEGYSHLLQAILHSASDGILAVGPDDQVLFANERFVELWRIPHALMDTNDDSLLLQYVLDQLVDPQGFLQKVKELYHSDDESLDTLHFKDGRVFDRLSRPLFQGTKLHGRVWSFRDVTERKQAEETLQQAETKYRILVEHIPAAVYLWELGDTGRCHYISPQIEAMLGFSVQEWLTEPDLFFKQIHPNDRAGALAAEIHSRDTGEPLYSEFRMLTREGRVIWIQDESFVIPGNEGRPQLNQGILMDITQRKQAEAELRRTKDELETINLQLQKSLEREKLLACTDGLTGVYNHRHFFQVAEHEFQATLRYRRPLAFMMFDMDDFKQVNDTLGHAVGDKLLTKVAQVAVAQVRGSDIVARYGGDEFIIMLPQATAQQALPIAERIRESVAAILVETPKGPLPIRLSIGIAETKLEPPLDESAERVVQRADRALYKAKHIGRNRTVIYDQGTVEA